MTIRNPLYLQEKLYPALHDRAFLDGILAGEGVLGPGDLKPVLSSGVTTSVAAGKGMVRGDTNPGQGLYEFECTASENQAHTRDVTNPRINMVVARVYDSTEVGSGSDGGAIEIVAGTPTPGATLDNRSGAVALPASAMMLADVLVPVAGDATVRDRRPFVCLGAVPPIKTAVEMVVFQDACGASVESLVFDSGDEQNQVATLVYLPRRIVGATRIRWGYQHISATPGTGNYVFGIYDASGRKIIDTGVVALVGAGSDYHANSLTISATNFEAGLYYLLFGFDHTSNSIAASCFSHTTNTTPTLSGAGWVNAALRSATGGTTAPDQLQGFTDVAGTNGTGHATVAVPRAALSIG